LDFVHFSYYFWTRFNAAIAAALATVVHSNNDTGCDDCHLGNYLLFNEVVLIDPKNIRKALIHDSTLRCGCWRSSASQTVDPIDTAESSSIVGLCPRVRTLSSASDDTLACREPVSPLPFDLDRERQSSTYCKPFDERVFVEDSTAGFFDRVNCLVENMLRGVLRVRHQNLALGSLSKCAQQETEARRKLNLHVAGVIESFKDFGVNESSKANT
jgi:hypothetical protein